MLVRIIIILMKIISRLFFNKKQEMKDDAKIPTEHYTTW